MRNNDRLAIVIQEIIQDKIYLDVSGEVQTRNETAQETIRNAIFNSTTD
jgi:DNA-directed RNA polymerase subunit omega